MKIKSENMRRAVEEDFSNATDLADYLVKKGLPFRKSHEISGKIVRHCIERKIYLKDLSTAEFKNFSEKFSDDIHDAIKPETCVNSRNSLGGTSTEQVKNQIELAKKFLNN